MIKGMLKKLFVVLVVLVLAAIVGAVYFWKQATRLPDWYDPETGEAVAPLDGAEVDEILESVEAPVKRGGSPRSEVRFDDRQLSALVVRALDEHADGRRVRRATKAIHASVAGERLTIGAVTDLERLRGAAENDEQREAIRKLVDVAPWIGGRDFYVGLSGRPRARGGRVYLEDLKVDVGGVSVDAAFLAARLGVSADAVAGGVELPLAELGLADVRIEDGLLVLVPATPASR